MFCNKCGGAVPDESKFCPHCGAMQAEAKKDIFCIECGLMLQPGTMFCPVCGTPADGSKPSANAIPAAPAASASGGMETVSASQPAPQSVPQPSQPVREAKPSDAVFGAFNSAFGEEPKPSDMAFGTPSGGVSLEKPAAAAEPKPSDIAFSKSAAAAEPKPSDIAFSKSAAAAEPNTSDIAFAKPSDMALGAAGTASEEARAYAPAQNSSPLEQTQLTKKSGKKWVIPAVGAAAAAVVVGGGALVYNLNKSDVTNMLMGNSGYAKMLEQGFVKSVSDNSDNAALAGAAESVMAMAVSSNMSTSSIGELESIASDAMDGDFGAIAESSGSQAGEFSIDMGAAIEQLFSCMTEFTGYSGADVKISAEAKITETLRSLIVGDNSDVGAGLDEALDMINSAEYQFSVLSSKESAAMYMGLNDKSTAFSFGVSGICYSDGTVGIMFPRTSDAAIKYTIESDGSVTVEKAAVLKIDEKEVERLKNEIIDLYLSYYEKGEISVENADGIKTVTVKISGAQLAEMIQQAAALIAEDEYFSTTIIDYINANGGRLTIEEYKKSITDSVSDINPSENAALVITSKVNKQNKLVSKKYAAVQLNTDKSVELGYNVKDKETELFFAVNDETSQVFTVLIEAENDTDGVVTVSFDEFDGGEKPENGDDYVFEIKYSDCKQQKFGKLQVLTGNFEASLKKAISLDTSDTSIVNSEILAVLRTTKLVYNSNLEAENILNQKFAVEIPQYGSLALKFTETLTNDVPEKLPDGAISLNKYISEDITEDDINEIMDTVKKLRDDIIKKCEGSKSKFAGYISEGANDILDSLVESMTPKASADDINEINALADELNNRCYAYYYSDALDDELKAELDSIVERISSTYLWGEVSMSDYTKSKEALADIEKAIDEFAEKLGKAIKEGIEALYNDMTVDELEEAKPTLDYLYDYLADEYSAQIKADAELSEEFEKVTELKWKLDSTYNDMEDMIEDGDIHVATIRSFRKAAAAFDIQISEFYGLLNSKILY